MVTDVNTMTVLELTVQRGVGMAAEGTGGPAGFMMSVGNVFNMEILVGNSPVEHYKEAQSQHAFPQV